MALPNISVPWRALIMKASQGGDTFIIDSRQYAE